MSYAYAIDSVDAVERIAEKHFGVRAFRPGQRALIDAVLAGKDAIGILPTGGGKSLCFQLPALFLNRTVVVVAPLLALIADQSAKLETLRVPAARLESTRGVGERAKALRDAALGELDVVYVTPEQLLRQDVMRALTARGVSLFVVDEAHCVSEWGHDFRPAYLGLRHVLRELGSPPVLALTATASEAVAGDIVTLLGMRDPEVVRTSPARPNICVDVRRVADDAEKLSAVHEVLREWPAQGIVYTASVKTAARVSSALTAASVVGGVGVYHGELSARARAAAMAGFMDGRVRVLVATKAFGMGVDKPDVRFVVHYEMPESLASHAQEIGRAGRDGRPALARMLYRRADRRVWDFLHRGACAQEEHIRAAVAAVFAAREGEVVDAELAGRVACHEGRETLDGRGRPLRRGIGVRKLTVLLWEMERLGVVRREGLRFVRGAAKRDSDFSEASLTARLVRRARERNESEKERLEEVIAFAELGRVSDDGLLALAGIPVER